MRRIVDVDPLIECLRGVFYSLPETQMVQRDHLADVMNELRHAPKFKPKDEEKAK